MGRKKAISVSAFKEEKMNKNNEIEAVELSARDLGKVLGLSDRQIRNLATEGVVVPGSARGRYRLAETARRYIASVKKPDVQNDLEREIAEQRLQALRVQNAMKDGDIIALQEAEAVVDRVIACVTGPLNGLPIQIAGRHNMRERQRIEEIVDSTRVDMVEAIKKARLEWQAELETSKRRR